MLQKLQLELVQNYPVSILNKKYPVSKEKSDVSEEKMEVFISFTVVVHQSNEGMTCI